MSLFLAELMVHACKGPLSWGDVQSVFDRILDEEKWPKAHVDEIQAMLDAIAQYEPGTADPEAAMKSIGCHKGISGYVLHTAIAAAWFTVRSQGDVREAIRLSIEAGGDTDSVAAVAAALTACSPEAVMPENQNTAFAGCIEGRGKLLHYSIALCNEDHLRYELHPEPTVREMFSDNLRALRVMLRHILWRRLF